MDLIAEARRQWVAQGWADAADGMAAVTSVMRAQQLLQARVDEVLRPLGLTFARYELLTLLSFSGRGSMPLKKASERLQVHPTSVTNAVDRLEAAGLVERLPHPTDGRATLVSLTDEGRRTALKATEALNAEVFARPGLSPDRTRELVDVLTDLRRDAGDL
ncbi:MAG: MarR family transcriptional regulator [Mycobacteriales bacterium]|nr:MarR family transcriptional regulator [Mycobacteriales bacterium]